MISQIIFELDLCVLKVSKKVSEVFLPSWFSLLVIFGQSCLYLACFHDLLNITFSKCSVNLKVSCLIAEVKRRN